MIEWLDDSLPDLAAVRARKEAFDLVMLTAVWMHLDEAQRQRAMPNVSALVRNGGIVIMSLRHGPIPPGRRMCAEEIRAPRKRYRLFGRDLEQKLFVPPVPLFYLCRLQRGTA
jgi:SAM-dependent methyltransferase